MARPLGSAWRLGRRRCSLPRRISNTCQRTATWSALEPLTGVAGRSSGQCVAVVTASGRGQHGALCAVDRGSTEQPASPRARARATRRRAAIRAHARGRQPCTLGLRSELLCPPPSRARATRPRHRLKSGRRRAATNLSSWPRGRVCLAACCGGHSVPKFQRQWLLVTAACASLCLAARRVPFLRTRSAPSPATTWKSGMINEPVYVGDKSGLEFSVFKDDEPVEGLGNDTHRRSHLPGRRRRATCPSRLATRSRAGTSRCSSPLRPAHTAFHIHGTIEGNANR